MQRNILIVDADKEQCAELLDLLRTEKYRAMAIHSLDDAEDLVRQLHKPIVILDLDSVPITNRILRTLRKSCPHLPIVALSHRPFHPELQEAMADHIYACLRKPLDPDEMFFWLKSISTGSEKDADVMDQP